MEGLSADTDTQFFGVASIQISKIERINIFKSNIDGFMDEKKWTGSLFFKLTTTTSTSVVVIVIKQFCKKKKKKIFLVL